MKSLILFVIGASFTPLLHADTAYKCDYAFMGMPTSSVEVLIYADGTPAASVSVTMHGRTHKESATPEALAADEAAHLWISKENPENTIEMVVYRNRKASGNSVLINHNVPYGKEMWGECAATEGPAN